jgi:CRP-like cAMP-binding protein
MTITNPVTRLPSLRPVPIFRGLNKGSLLQVARKSVEVTYPQDAVVVREGDPGDSLCIIVSGAVEVRKKDHAVARLQPGDFFGEISLIDGEPRSATVVAVEDLTLLTISSEDFCSLLADTYFACAVLKSLATRFREMLEAHEAPGL